MDSDFNMYEFTIYFWLRIEMDYLCICFMTTRSDFILMNDGCNDIK